MKWMPLTLRSTKLAPPVYEHMGDYEVLDGDRSIGRIYALRRYVPTNCGSGQSRC
jgi:hypothetical protein